MDPHGAPTVQTIDNSKHITILHKVHIRGVDDLTTDDLKAFAAEHHPMELPVRFEWIDDTSANLVYDTPAAAMRALESFSSGQIKHQPAPTSALLVRSAKKVSNRPESRLEVRLAVNTDVKQRRAHEASRFYMMHPEHDPREKARLEKSSGRSGHYEKRRYDNIEHRRRRLQDRERSYKASMYDDSDTRTSAGQSSTSRRSSISVESNASPLVDGRMGRRKESRHGQRGDYYRPGTNSERTSLRKRSASPGKDVDSFHTFDKRRVRRRSPPSLNRDKELFPVRSSTSTKSSLIKELIPNKSIAASLRKELFPAKTNTHHRRSDAFDAADEAADLFAGVCDLREEALGAQEGDSCGFVIWPTAELRPRASVRSR